MPFLDFLGRFQKRIYGYLVFFDCQIFHIANQEPRSTWYEGWPVSRIMGGMKPEAGIKQNDYHGNMEQWMLEARPMYARERQCYADVVAALCTLLKADAKFQNVKETLHLKLEAGSSNKNVKQIQCKNKKQQNDLHGSTE
jgi:hypothetical protein